MRHNSPFLRSALACLCLLGIASGAHAQTGLPLDSIDGSYPRLIRLDHSSAHSGAMIATFTAGAAGGPNSGNPIYRADAGTTSWGYVTTVNTSLGSGPYSCCSTLFEFPQQLGNFGAGTILLAARTDTGSNAAITIWRSTDGGDNWTYHSTLANVGDASGGIWEPEFNVDSSGNLIIYYSDERNQPNSGQLIVHEVSNDGGLTWGSYTVDVGKTDGSRPGMPRVVHTPNGYVMAYEYCGTDNCRLHTRTSSDGDNWGDPTDDGPLVESFNGAHFQGTPSIVYKPGGTGVLGIIGRRLIDSGGDPASSPDNAAMYTQDLSGASGWVDNPAPYPTPGSLSDSPQNCTNYSSTLLSSADGSTIYMVAGIKTSESVCNVYVGPF